MKLVLYDDFQLGVLQGEAVVPAGDSVADLGHHTSLTLGVLRVLCG